MDVLARLKDLGFGDYEAKAYASLVASGQCNGYAVAKDAGVPRANVYGVLARLVERGAAQRFDTPHGVRYVAISPERLLARLEHDHRLALNAAQKALATIAQPDASAPAFNLRGRDETIAQAVADIDSASKTLLVAIQPVEAAQLAEPLRRARERGVTITTLCLEACEHECGDCQGQIHRMQKQPNGSASWLLLVIDQRLALLAQFDAATAEGVVTARHLVVELTSAYIRQSLILALLASELGEGIEDLLSTQALQALNRLYPDGDFLAHIQGLGDLASS
ncbi:MAG: helix-turn-helix domain-containing protein [Rudaea sp.]